MSDAVKQNEVSIDREDFEMIQSLKRDLDEIDVLVSSCSLEEFGSSRTLILAVVHLIRSCGYIAGKLRRSTKRNFPEIPWDLLFSARYSVPINKTDYVIDDVWTHVHKLLLEARTGVAGAVERSIVNDTNPARETADQPPDDGDPDRREQRSTSAIFGNHGLGTKKRLPDKYSRNLSGRMSLANDPAIDCFRREVEVWFLNLDDEDQRALRGRFINDDNRQHLSAFYELFFHQYFLRKGWSVEKDPEFDQVSPDFLVNTGEFGSFIIEQFSVIQNKWNTDSFQTFRNLLRRLDRFRFNFLLSVHMTEWCQELELDLLEDHIYDWIYSLKQKEGATFHLDIDGYGFKGFVVATKYDVSNLLYGPVYKWSTPDVPERKIVGSMLRKKAMRYKFVKEEESPFVVAVCLEDRMSIDEIEICRNLYGDVSILSDASGKRVNLLMKQSEPAFLQKDIRTRVSAILVCVRRWCETHMEYDMRVFHNPWAKEPLDERIFAHHPQLVRRDDFDDTYLLYWREETHTTFVLR